MLHYFHALICVLVYLQYKFQKGQSQSILNKFFDAPSLASNQQGSVVSSYARTN